MTSTSKEGLKKLSEEIARNPATHQIQTREPKTKLLQVKVIGIQHDVSVEDIPTVLVNQNRLTCDPGDIQVLNHWKGKNGTTAILSTKLPAYQSIVLKESLHRMDKLQVLQQRFPPKMQALC